MIHEKFADWFKRMTDLKEKKMSRAEFDEYWNKIHTKCNYQDEYNSHFHTWLAAREGMADKEVSACALKSEECEHSDGISGDFPACWYKGECPHKRKEPEKKKELKDFVVVSESGGRKMLTIYVTEESGSTKTFKTKSISVDKNNSRILEIDSSGKVVLFSK